MNFHHIGIVVTDLDEAVVSLKNTIDIVSTSETIEDPGILVYVQFLIDSNDICYELIAPMNESSPVAKAAHENRNNLHHLAYVTDNFDFEFSRLRGLGHIPLGKAQPAVAFQGKRVAFFLTDIHTIFELVEQ